MKSDLELNVALQQMNLFGRILWSTDRALKGMVGLMPLPDYVGRHGRESCERKLSELSGDQ